MSSTMPHDRVTRLHLEAGQTLHLSVDARTTLRLLTGAAVLHEAPVWLGERMVGTTHRLVPGQPCRPARPGWLRIDAADEAVDILCQREPAWTALAWQGLAARLAAWRGSLRGVAKTPRAL